MEDPEFVEGKYGAHKVLLMGLVSAGVYKPVRVDTDGYLKPRIQGKVSAGVYVDVGVDSAGTLKAAETAVAEVLISEKIYRDNRQVHQGGGYLYGFYFINERSGRTYCFINDAYFAHDSSEDINVGKIFEPGAESYGSMHITFPSPIRYEIGLRMGWYSSTCSLYLWYDPD